MKTLLRRILALSCGLGVGLLAVAQPAEPPANEPPPPETNSPAVEPLDQPAPPAREEISVAPPTPDVVPATAEPSVPGPEPAATDATAAVAVPTSNPPSTNAVTPVAEGQSGLRLNFRNAPLEMVLNYLSEAAGFIIDLRTDVKGKVDVWSNQPLTRDEAVGVLNGVLNRNGYAAIRNGRTLTIVSKEDAKKLDIPVISGNDPARIPKSEEIVTQVVPVRFINATQLIKDLQPLLPTSTQMTANEGGNALVITDTQTNIRRMAEIVRALDTAISSTSAIRVFMLKYADAKALATVVRDLFQTQTTQQQVGNNPMQQFFRGMRGGNAADAGAAGSGNARVATPRVNATSDDRSNALVVSAPEDQMAIIEDLVRQVDTNVDDVTELRVFHLVYADPQETADMLASLFPDTTTSNNNQGGRGQFRFGGRMNNAANTPSERLLKQTRVIAVPDLRTGSVVVSAARDLMEQIAPIIESLDADPRRKKKVFVIDAENTDPQMMQSIVQNLFPSQTTGSSAYNRNSSQQVGNQLNNRATSSSTQNSFINTSTQNRTGNSMLGR